MHTTKHSATNKRVCAVHKSCAVDEGHTSRSMHLMRVTVSTPLWSAVKFFLEIPKDMFAFLAPGAGTAAALPAALKG